MKSVIWTLIKPLLTAIGLIWSGFMAFDYYDTSKILAHTEPLKREMKAYNNFTKESLDRLERESMMIRQNQDRTHELLLIMSRKK